MAVVKIDELMKSIKTKIGDSTADEDLKLIEDVTDTFKELSENENWKTKFEENDKQWREKYKARFFDSPSTQPEGTPGPNQTAPSSNSGKGSPTGTNEPEKTKTFEDLFKVG